MLKGESSLFAIFLRTSSRIHIACFSLLAHHRVINNLLLATPLTLPNPDPSVCRPWPRGAPFAQRHPTIYAYIWNKDIFMAIPYEKPVIFIAKPNAFGFGILRVSSHQLALRLVHTGQRQLCHSCVPPPLPALVFYIKNLPIPSEQGQFQNSKWLRVVTIISRSPCERPLQGGLVSYGSTNMETVK